MAASQGNGESSQNSNDSPANSQTPANPWPHIHNFFEFSGTSENNLEFENQDQDTRYYIEQPQVSLEARSSSKILRV